MKKLILLTGVAILACTQAWAEQRPASGREAIPFTNTISCIQNGYVVEQYARVWAVERSWNRDQYTISFRMPDGEARTIDYSNRSMICRIEKWGEETVPVAERIAAERQQQAEDEARQQRVEEFKRSRQQLP